MKEILIAKKLLIQSEIVDAASKVVKDAELIPSQNVWEVSAEKMKRLDNALFELGNIESEIEQWGIDNL